ncbi:hypothetical protein [Marmoricola sp. URHB0036]|uniref:hypothetical protein n=1 Tax=Marmoricola sp. URHB0036 TaxID=1298863 RepID=UPI0018C9C213|nr:hypothetical protein [Marmoricola sp. URHB0036]
MRRLPLRQLVLLVVGCLVLGTGVAMLLTADLGSDGFSTLVNGTAIRTGLPFFVANLGISLAFLLLAAARRLLPGVGTVVQIVLVGLVVDRLLPVLDKPDSVLGQALLLTAAFPVLSLGIAAYLGAHLGAGPIEAAALAWDPPLPFKWSYSVAQFGGAALGWLLGATIGPGTVAVILLLGPAVDLTSRLLGLDVHQRMES